MLSDRDGVHDFAHVVSIHFGRLSCRSESRSFASSFRNENNSRAQISFNVDDTKPGCALPVVNDALTFLNLDDRCGETIVPGEIITGLEYEPRCLMLVLSADHERQFFDDAMRQGRDLSNPFRVEVNFTIGTGEEPNVEYVSANCGNSRMLMTNYLLDKTFQSETDELIQLRLDIARASERISEITELRKWTPVGSYDQSGNWKLWTPPPPPPGEKGFDDMLEGKNNELDEMRAREGELEALLGPCIGSRVEGNVCGLPSSEAPHPWMAIDGPCRGYDTIQTRELDYCGYWCEVPGVASSPSPFHPPLLPHSLTHPSLPSDPLTL